MKLKKLAENMGVEFIEKPNGHIQLKGPLTVNYYPRSKCSSAYIAGTKKKINHVTGVEALNMCFKAPKRSRVKDRRSLNSRQKRKAMLKKGMKKCCWCECDLTLDTSTIEHVIPLARGGLDNTNNRKLACEPCNSARGSDMPELTKQPQKTG